MIHGTYKRRKFMREIYLTFLGVGSYSSETGKYSYQSCRYSYNGKVSSETCYIQKGEIELLEHIKFDHLLIAATEKSFSLHFDNLKSELEAEGLKNIHYIPLSEDLSGEAQWKNFEMLISFFNRGDHLTVDITHGFRVIPVYFSAAINFLQKSKGIKLNHVLYGAYEKRDSSNTAPVIDMKNFYIINEWADAVSRLVDDADASKLACMTSENSTFSFKVLNNKKFIDDLQKLSLKIKGVDIHEISDNAGKIIANINQPVQGIEDVEKILMGLIEEKFSPLTSESAGKLYDAEYFRLQINIIELLLEHELYMQAFTVMREYIASLGMSGLETQKKKRNRKHAEIFLIMLRRPEEQWSFKGEDNEMMNNMLHVHKTIESMGLKKRFQGFIEDMLKLRNGFDHAWTGGMKHKLPDDIGSTGKFYLNEIKDITEILIQEELFN
jgi:CRISPR-associated DxTHG motif protein